MTSSEMRSLPDNVIWRRFSSRVCWFFFFLTFSTFFTKPCDVILTCSDIIRVEEHQFCQILSGNLCTIKGDIAGHVMLNTTIWDIKNYVLFFMIYQSVNSCSHRVNGFSDWSVIRLILCSDVSLHWSRLAVQLVTMVIYPIKSGSSPHLTDN